MRPYEPRDRDACRALWVELTEWHRAIYARPEIGGSEPGLAFDRHLEHADVWVAEVDGDVVGLAGLDGDELEPVVVAERARGGGVGGALVDAVLAEARARGLKRVRVRPVARNAEAIRFFRARGFAVLTRVELQLELEPRDDWRDGQDIAGQRFRF